MNKMVSWERAKEIVDRAKDSGAIVVFTNGVFDLIHPGHVRVLEKARSLGDLLVLGLNTDESVRRLKGPERPILTLNERAEVLSAIQFVDLIVPFEEDTPYELINHLRPHILVKGGDYKPEEVVGRDLVDKVIIVPLKEGISTSEIIERIKERYC